MSINVGDVLDLTEADYKFGHGPLNLRVDEERRPVSDDQPRNFAEENKVALQIADRRVEMNTILRSIGRRRHGEPSAAQRERLEVLRAEILALKRGQDT